MKIAFDARELTLSQPPAGIGRYIHGLFTAMAEDAGAPQMSALCHDNTAPFPHPDRYQAIDLSSSYIGKWSQLMWEFLRWGKAMDRLSVDLFHSTAHLVPGRMKTPLVLTVHDLTNFLFPSWYRYTNQINRRWNLQRGIRQAKKIIAVSHATRNDLCRLFPQYEAKVEVIHEGPDPIFQPHPEVTRIEIGLEFDNPFILWAGTTSPRKNLPVLLDAFEKIHKKIPEVHLVLLGQRGWKDQTVFDDIRERRMLGVVHPMGYQPWEMLPLFYSACSVFVFPSLYEGFGLPVIEAMACGAAVLAADTSSLPELVTNEDARFDPKDSDQLAEKLCWVLNNSSVREGLQREGLERSRQFSWQRAAKQTIELYEQTLG